MLKKTIFAIILGGALNGAAFASAPFKDCLKFFPTVTPLHQHSNGMRALCFSEFAVMHSAATRTPMYVVEKISAKSLAKAKSIKRTDRFYEEARLPKAERAYLSDYAKSGYDRGHLAAAGNMSTPEGMAQSFSLANMIPQIPAHNRGTWAEVEDVTRKFTRRAAGDVFIFTGAVFDGNKKTPSGRVGVPSHLYKLVFDSASSRAWAFWIPHSSNAKIGKVISYGELKQKTGIDFLPGLNVKN